MPKNPNFILEVSIRISEAFTLDSIVRRPRTFKPKDVLAACQNNEVLVRTPQVPPPVLSLATFIMTDFFALAHATGLYNRQRLLWESLSKVTHIHVFQLSTGLLSKKPLGIFDLVFQDYKGKPLVIASLVEQDDVRERALYLDNLKSFIGRVHRRCPVAGIFAVFPGPFPEPVLHFVRSSTNSSDPVARYESILPAVRAPINLLEMQDVRASDCQSSEQIDAAALEEGGIKFNLIHPDLKRTRLAACLAARKTASDDSSFEDVGS